MSDTNIKAIRKENEALKAKLEAVVREMSTLKEKLDKQCQPLQSSSNEQAKSLQYLSDEYDDLKLFKSSTDKEIKRLDTKLTDIILKFDKISEQIDAIEQYSYNYNVKIIGIPQTQDRNETAADTADICINLFHSIGETNVTLQDIDIAHRIPTRGASSKPNSIICKFTRRLAKEAVISKKKETRKLTPADFGLDRRAQLDHIGIFDHLTPKLQQLLYEAKRFKTENNYQYCWSKSSAIFLRENAESRAIKLRNMGELERLKSENGHTTTYS